MYADNTMSRSDNATLPPGYERVWNINPIDPQEGSRFYVVTGETNGAEVRFPVTGWDCERRALELRDTLNRVGRTFTTHAC